jgi:hypothetical protein
MQNKPLRIAMWCGPRNISTALLRSWGNRADTYVCDEPLYAHYLKTTGKQHPGADEVIAHQENDWQKVIDWLLGPVPEGKNIFYQKHMSHHLLPNIGRDWLTELTNCFLIRDPREMITSLIKIVPDAKVEDTGLPQQVEIFELIREATGETPPVLDSKETLDNPEAILKKLCERLDVEFTENMLSWPPGTRETDGVWAKHWYSSVNTSTEFRPFKPKTDEITAELQPLYEECQKYYDQLYQHRLTA